MTCNQIERPFLLSEGVVSEHWILEVAGVLDFSCVSWPAKDGGQELYLSLTSPPLLISNGEWAWVRQFNSI